MRSSVSVILSDPPASAAMCAADYHQTPLDHQALLVVVKQVGKHLKTRTFNRLYERICRLQRVCVTESASDASATGITQPSTRHVTVRYRRSYPPANNEWGDFQTHRRVLALITIGQVSSQQELVEVSAQHETLRARYRSTLLDTRCVLLGVNADGTAVHSAPASRSCSLAGPDGASVSLAGLVGGDRDSGVYDHSEHGHSSMSDSSGGAVVSGSSDDEDNSCQLQQPPAPAPRLTPPPGASQSPAAGSDQVKVPEVGGDCGTAGGGEGGGEERLVLPPALRSCGRWHSSVDSCCRQLELQVKELCASLFWVLEARRLERTPPFTASSSSSTFSGRQQKQQQQRLPLLCAPFERKDFIGLDMDSRSSRRRLQGRHLKHLADLTLQTGLPDQALEHYQAASDLLRHSNDWLWLAGCYEGMCASSVSIHYPNLRQSSFHRIFSLKDSRSERHTRSSGSSSLPHKVTASSHLKLGRHCLSASEIVDKYREAVVQYSKYRHAAVVETECSLKAVHVLIEQKRFLTATEFLQNVVFINLQLSDEEKIQRFTTLSDLYGECGMMRKAAYLRRLAAMRCVASRQVRPQWTSCYHLLLQALPGYRLSLQPQHLLPVKGGSPGVVSGVSVGGSVGGWLGSGPEDGWSELQSQLLLDLVGAARRSGDCRLAVHHLAQLVGSWQLFCSMTAQQRSEQALQLETLVGKLGAAEAAAAAGGDSRDEGSVNDCLQQQQQQQLELSSLLLPPVQLYTLPLVRSFRPLAYSPHLRPQLIEPEVESAGPFIFSALPLHQQALSAKHSDQTDFLWVQDELSQVEIVVENLLSADLRVTGVCLVTDDSPRSPSSPSSSPSCSAPAVAAVDQFPSCLSLAAHSGAHCVNLVAAPRSPGRLAIVGYSVTVLGLTASCRLAHVPWLPVARHYVSVVPPLPQLLVHSSVSGYPGACPFDQSGNVNAGSVTLYNGETCEVVLTLRNSSSSLPVDWLEINLEPAQSSNALQYDVTSVTSQLPLAAGSHVTLPVQFSGHADFVLSPDSDLGESLNVCDSAVTVGTVNSVTVAPPSASTLSLTASSANHSSLGKTHSTKVVSAVFRVRYSGGEGMAAGYCRSLTVSLTFNIVPSVHITNWDVIPAESPNWCYLSLDVLNALPEELQVVTADRRRLQVDSGDTCRLAVKTPRCPPADNQTEAENSDVTSHVTESVRLAWSTCESSPPACRRHGNIALGAIVWRPHQLQLLRRSSLLWDVRIDGVRVDEQFCAGAAGATSSCSSAVAASTGGGGDLPVCRVALPCLLSVAVTNCSQRPLVEKAVAAALLRVRVFQPSQAYCGAAAPSVVLGAASRALPQLLAGEQVCHTVSLLCFAPGVYKVAVQFSLLPSDGATGSTDLCTFVTAVQAVT